MAYTLRQFGSYFVGGRVAEVTEGEPRTIQFTRTNSFEYDPKGHFAIEHAYVQFFEPEARNAKPPVVLVHGGGMSGSCWETTPDGRPGWLHLLLDRGYEVHVVDATERGRAGFAPAHFDGTPILRSMEEAWSLFRIGTKENFGLRRPFENQQFPVANFIEFAKCFVPRWLSTTPLQVNALISVLHRTGPAIVICHSQGGEIAFDAFAQEPQLFEAIIALEPSGNPAVGADFTQTPTHIVAGDFLDINQMWKDRRKVWQSLAAVEGVTFSGPERLGAGNSHMLMMDLNSDHVLDVVLDY